MTHELEQQVNHEYARLAVRRVQLEEELERVKQRMDQLRHHQEALNTVKNNDDAEGEQ